MPRLVGLYTPSLAKLLEGTSWQLKLERQSERECSSCALECGSERQGASTRERKASPFRYRQKESEREALQAALHAD